jgi:hypothetical protein
MSNKVCGVNFDVLLSNVQGRSITIWASAGDRPLESRQAIYEVSGRYVQIPTS